MNECIKVTVEADKGTTVKSPNFFGVEEILPPDADIATIEAGILDGSYTPINLDEYTYEGKLKTGYSEELVTDLNLSVDTKTIEGTPTGGGTNTYKILTFKILPDVTTTWDNREYDLLFDIKRTEISDTTNVDIWVKGTIKVKAVITE